MDEIDLAEQIGRGGFGAVYKGTWRGAPVAVKYAVCNVQDVDSIEGAIREVVLSKKMSHPNVVCFPCLSPQHAIRKTCSCPCDAKCTSSFDGLIVLSHELVEPHVT